MENILYINDLKVSVEVYYSGKLEKIDKTFDKFINELCLIYLSTVDGRKESFKKIFGYKYNIPIFVSEKMLFLKVSNNIWINVYQIKEIIKKEKDLVLILSNNEIISILNGYYKNIRKIKEINKVFSYIEKM